MPDPKAQQMLSITAFNGEGDNIRQKAETFVQEVDEARATFGWTTEQAMNTAIQRLKGKAKDWLNAEKLFTIPTRWCPGPDAQNGANPVYLKPLFISRYCDHYAPQLRLNAMANVKQEETETIQDFFARVAKQAVILHDNKKGQADYQDHIEDTIVSHITSYALPYLLTVYNNTLNRPQAPRDILALMKDAELNKTLQKKAAETTFAVDSKKSEPPKEEASEDVFAIRQGNQRGRGRGRGRSSSRGGGAIASNGKPLTCHACGQPGHFARECRPNIPRGRGHNPNGYSFSRAPAPYTGPMNVQQYPIQYGQQQYSNQQNYGQNRPQYKNQNRQYNAFLDAPAFEQTNHINSAPYTDPHEFYQAPENMAAPYQYDGEFDVNSHFY